MGHLRELIFTWQFAPVITGTVLASIVAYVWAARSVSRRHPLQPWPTWPTVSFVAGMAILLYVTAGSVGAYDDEFFWAHMVQHIVLMMLVAPLLVLGEPVLLLLRVCRPQFRRRYVVPVLRSRLVRVVTNPVLTWLVFAGVLFGTHFTAFFEYSLTHPLVHDYIEHTLYLGAGLLYYYPLLGVSPGASALPPFAKVVSLFLMMIPEAVVGFAIYTAGSVLFPFYETVDRPWGPSTALLDQRLGGAFMWSAGMIFHAVWISVAVWEWFTAEGVKARRIDQAIAAEQAAQSG